MANFLRLYREYVKASLAGALEYRFSFFSQIAGMFFNDMLWVSFWALYFTKFPVVSGWAMEDVMVLWASFALSYGLVASLMSNAFRIPTLVVNGQLDYYLALPKDVLAHLLMSQIRPLNLGDVLFGTVLVLVMVKLTWIKLAVFLLTTLLAACVLLGLAILSGSLVFFIGNAEGVAGQVINAVVHFSTYPAPIFDNAVKILLFTILPAGFITTLPVELVREFHWAGFLQLLGGAVAFLGAGILLFRAGLKRYESGNLMMMRS